MLKKIYFTLLLLLSIIVILLAEEKGITLNTIKRDTNLGLFDRVYNKEINDKIISSINPVNDLKSVYLKTDSNNKSMVKINEEKWKYNIFTNVKGIDDFCKIENELLKIEYIKNKVILSKEQVNRFGEEKITKNIIKCLKNINYYEEHSLDWAINTK